MASGLGGMLTADGGRGVKAKNAIYKRNWPTRLSVRAPANRRPPTESPFLARFLRRQCDL